MTTGLRLSRRCRGRIALRLYALLLVLSPGLAGAGDEFPGGAYGYGPPTAFAPRQSAPQYLAPAVLETLVEPIAHYPEVLVERVLAASTYPLQIVQAARLLAATGGVPAPQDTPEWDDNIVALLAYPGVVAMMDRELDWTARLGTAVVHQHADVLVAVDAVRVRSADAGVALPVATYATQPEVVTVPDHAPSRVTIYPSAPRLGYYDAWPSPAPVPRFGSAAWAGSRAAWRPRTTLSFGWSDRDYGRGDHGRRDWNGRGRRDHRDARERRWRDDRGDAHRDVRRRDRDEGARASARRQHDGDRARRAPALRAHDARDRRHARDNRDLRRPRSAAERRPAARSATRVAPAPRQAPRSAARDTSSPARRATMVQEAIAAHRERFGLGKR